MKTKKFAFIAGVMVLGATVAFASSLNVPFFLDNAPSDGKFPPSSKFLSVIGVHNNLSVDLEVEVDYFDGQANPATPAQNTFILPANTTYSFRPVGDDATTEGPAVVVPNMTGSVTTGSATLTWVGGPGDIQGRLVQTNSANNTFAFLLPPGQ